MRLSDMIPQTAITWVQPHLSIAKIEFGEPLKELIVSAKQSRRGPARQLRHVWRALKLRTLTCCAAIDPHIVFLRNTRNDIGYFLPYASVRGSDVRQLSILARGFHKHLLEKYTEGEVRIRASDTVIDCGAFVGGFTVAAAQSGAEKILSIEPSTRNYRCLRLNLCYYNAVNAVPLNIALGDKSGAAQLNLSRSGCDDSILEPDEGGLGTTELVKMETLKNLITQYQIDPACLYLKVEAEGFEPEILKGLDDLRPRVIVVDVTPERDGESPRDEIERILQGFGYTSLMHTRRCLFAIK